MENREAMGEIARRFGAGEADAAELLFARYGQRLIRLAEQQLSHRLAGRLDGEDVVQSVFRTFFRRSAGGEFQIDNSAQIWRLLVKITVMKARAKGRWHTADKRNVAAEAAAGDAFLVDALAHEPGPEEAVILMDQIEAMLAGLPSLHGRILELRLQGHGVQDIARQLNIARQTVYRALDLLQERLAKT
ncbi:MAG: helix-turn-helix domain-containing protein [Planctomycetes bacterium]|nr:helix-turn-helix domain-containing protein [Planctomycetota bacterium]